MSARKLLKAFQLTAVAFVAALLVVDVAWAQQKYPINTTGEGVTTRYVQQHTIDVGDLQGHQVRILEVQRTYPGRQLVVDGVRAVEGWTRGYSDYTNGIGPAWGYGIWVMEDGSKIFLEWRGTSYSETTATGSKRGTFHGTAKLLGGTGRFAKIRGLTTDVSEFDTDPAKGYSRVSSKGEYWFVE